MSEFSYLVSYLERFTRAYRITAYRSILIVSTKYNFIPSYIILNVHE